MNRRNMIKGTLGATAATLVPGAAIPGPMSREDVKHDVLIRLAKLKLSSREHQEMMIVGLTLMDGSTIRDDTLAWLNEDLPVSEVHRRIGELIEADWDA